MRSFRFWGIISLLLHSFLLCAHTGNIRFRHLTIHDGLSLSSVYCILQDSKGFIWFGTEDGLNRYDGRNFKVFRTNTHRKNQLVYKWVDHLLEDSQGLLWIGTRQGLSVFSPDNELFINYRHGNDTNQSLTNDTITCLLQGNKSSVWAGTYRGLNLINHQTGEITAINFPQSKHRKAPRINVLLTYGQENVWTGTSNGLYKVNDKGKVIDEIILPNQPEVISLALQKNTLWIGTDDGLYSIQLLTKKLRHYPVSYYDPRDKEVIESIVITPPNKVWFVSSQGLCLLNSNTGHRQLLVSDTTTTHSMAIRINKPIVLDDQENLWFGTASQGVYCINTNTTEILHYMHHQADNNSLAGNAINTIYQDRCGKVWLGTFGAGLSFYDPQSHLFNWIYHQAGKVNTLSSNFVWTVCESRDGSLWLGTNNHGISRYVAQQDTFIQYRPGSNSGGLPHASIRAIYEDRKGTIWVGTDGGGLCRMHKQSGKFKQYLHQPSDSTSLSDNSVRVIFEDSQNNMWIGTRHGLNKLNQQQNNFKRYLHQEDDSTTLSNDFIYSLINEDLVGNLWIGTYGGGVNRMNIATEKITRYRYHADQRNTISDDVVFSMASDSLNRLWFGTNNGLSCFYPAADTFIRYGIAEGLPNEVIYGLLPDKSGNFWLSTNRGICCFNPYTYATKSYNADDGLQSNEFNGGAFHAGGSGRLYFAGVYGVNSFLPEQLINTQNNAHIYITRLDVLGHRVFTLHDSKAKSPARISALGPKLVMPTDIAYTDAIYLDYAQRYFTLEFTAVNSSQQDNMHYSYIMEGADEEWKSLGQRNYISYANMPHGDYTFKVKAQNSDGVWSPHEAALKISIEAPYWATWWFHLFIGIVALVLAVFIYRYLVKARTARILALKNEHIRRSNLQLTRSEQALRQTNAAKDKFFSIIAHDLKNPFTSLLSLSETLTRHYAALDEEERLEGVSSFHRSAKRIYALLENLLTWSRVQTGRIPCNPISFNISVMLADATTLLEMPLQKKKLTIDLSSPPNVMVTADSDMIDTVIRNLLHNAIKYSMPNGIIKIHVHQKESQVEVDISDEGCGIAPDRLPHLFNIAQKSNTDGTAGEKGSGLGLIICKEFVERNHGTLTVTSTLNIGSTFSFTLPVGS